VAFAARIAARVSLIDAVAYQATGRGITSIVIDRRQPVPRGQADDHVPMREQACIRNNDQAAAGLAAQCGHGGLDLRGIKNRFVRSATANDTAAASIDGK
jgi:hypothetical protein